MCLSGESGILQHLLKVVVIVHPLIVMLLILKLLQECVRRFFIICMRIVILVRHIRKHGVLIHLLLLWDILEHLLATLIFREGSSLLADYTTYLDEILLPTH